MKTAPKVSRSQITMSKSLLGPPPDFPNAPANLAPFVRANSRPAVIAKAIQYTRNEIVEKEISMGVWKAHTAPTLPAPAVVTIPAHKDRAAIAA